MKRRLCSIFMALVLCIGLLPAAARAEDDWTGWTQLTQADVTGEGALWLTDGGKYYLNESISITTSINFSGTVTLDLNGKTLSYDGSNGSSAISLTGSNLILQDSGTGGCITCDDKACGVRLTNGASFTMNSGSIQKCKTDIYSGSGVYVSSGCSFTMNGGSIQGCTASGTYSAGGGVFVEGSFTMNGGSITGNTAYIGPDVGLFGTMYANGGEVGHISISSPYHANKGTITRTASDTDADTYTAFTGSVSGNGTIEDAAKLTVTFEDSDGTPFAQQKVLKGQKLPEPTAPTKTDYAFVGWYTEIYAKWDFDSDTVDYNMPLFAEWNRIFTVTWDVNGGETPYTPTGATTTGVEGAPITAPSNAPTRAADDDFAYSFAGWYTAAEDGTELTTATIPYGHVTYYAHWNKTPIYTVTFDSNGGSAVDAQTVYHGGTVTEPKAPTKSGHRFDGWYLDGEKYDFATPVTGDVALTAKWTFLVDPDKLAKPEEKPTGNPFTDVSEANYFHGAVLWAVENDITGGTTATTFSPFASCTRAQAVTFLYRSALALGLDVSVGEDTNILSYNDAFDVPEYAIPAFQWACGMGIVTGNNGNLNPNSGCTRAQIVAFLWRFAKAAGMDVSVGEDTNILSYNDAFDVPEYAIPAFQWACGESIVTGNNGNLDPGVGCTRAQIVTFLWRLLAE